MKKSLWLFSLLLISGLAFTQQYHPVQSGSAVQFTIKNFGFNVGGSFTGLEGEIQFNPDKPDAGRFDVSVNAASINTDNNTRDGHLRDEDYLDVKKYPRIRFVSESISSARKKGEYQMKGKLTIKDKSQSISFPFTAQASGKGYVFNGSFKINRKDFGVGGSSTISDNLTVNLKVQAE